MEHPSQWNIMLQIKVLDPKSQQVRTLAGTGTAGFKDGVAQAGQVSCKYKIEDE